MNGLTPRQKRFVREYLKDHNGSEAYRRAGYDTTIEGAWASASRLLGNVKVKAAVEAGMAEQARRTLVDADYVVNGLKREAEERGDGSSHSARVSALSWLGKHLSMFEEKLAIKTDDLVEVTELVVRTRAEATKALSSVAEAARVPGLNGHH